ncbi:MAG: glycosyltransferase family 1 protein, partial [Patescibacteria group bacterium]|nr:glycosyltransferase family 1 protein [Patescibacteria group bacterium]
MLIGLDASRANRQKKTGTEWYSFYLIKELARLDRHNHYRLYLDKKPSTELQELLAAAPNFDFRILSWPFTSFWTLGRLSLEMLFNSP